MFFVDEKMKSRARIILESAYRAVHDGGLGMSPYDRREEVKLLVGTMLDVKTDEEAGQLLDALED